MKRVVWFLFTAFGLYGGFFLMPYKTAAANVRVTVCVAAVSLLLSLILGFTFSRNRSDPVFFLGYPLATFLLASGVLGVLVNAANNVEGTPLLAVLALMVGSGIVISKFLWGRGRAT